MRNDYIRGNLQFLTATMTGRTDAWRDGYLAAFYGKGDEDCKGKPKEYSNDFMEGFNNFTKIAEMNTASNRNRYRKKYTNM